MLTLSLEYVRVRIIPPPPTIIITITTTTMGVTS